ncbi:transcriptional activator hap3-like [Miscanthus floridulus]|uniref:transcriptional activator hap3-like n=1 Tax=Miscanthus floridulus TaxID=154761 RepID=UPI003459DB42
MGLKAKQCPAKKGGRDDKVAASSSDGEGVTGTRGLPMTNLVRLMRQVIPKRVKISSRAKDLTHDCALEFVGFLTGEAAERATAQHRRTIAPEDFTCSLQALGFDDYVKPMSTYISRYREQVNPAGYRGFARRPPPPATVVAAATAAPCVSDEETHGRVARHGECDDGGSTSVHAPTPSAHTSPDNM